MKKTVVPKPAPADKAVPDTELPIRILKSATCPTLSGRSTLTYEIGCTTDSVTVIRLKSNSGGGIFNRNWIELAVIRSLLDEHPEDKQVMSNLLLPLCKGRSVNSSPFLFAVLIAEGLVAASVGKPVIYHKGDTGKFFAEVDALIAAAGDVSGHAANDTESQAKQSSRKKSAEKSPE